MLRHTITAFKEYKSFDQKKPYSIVKMTFPKKIITSPHYADTIEILLCSNLIGECYIDGNKYDFSGNQIFFVAPNIIHSMNYEPNNGSLYVIKVYPLGLKRYMDLDLILKDCAVTFNDIPKNPSEYDRIKEIIEKLQIENNNIIDKMQSILQMFNCFISQINPSDISESAKIKRNDNIYKILNWTEKNYSNPISINEISSQLGYTKNYFCNKFKSQTGISYINYLNHVRISHACKLLKSGNNISLEQISEECGFSSVSYFITTFKKTVGTTPHSFRIKQ